MTRKSKISPEMLMAYADGELDAISAKRVERAIAEDPALAEQVEKRRAAKVTLNTHFGTAMHDPAESSRRPADVVDLGAARQAREAREAKAAAKASAPIPARTEGWRKLGPLIGALVVGVALGVISRPSAPGDFAMRGGQLEAGGGVAHALETRVASADGPVRLSFRDGAGSYCRVFETGAQGGVACRQGGAWQVRQLRAAGPQARGDVRQAATAAVMADARAMMVGDPLDAASEKAALVKGWQ
jgi:anti-sigma factor RsiW